MALITCKRCGNRVSTHATVCPKCGCPISESLEAQQTENINKEELTTIQTADVSSQDVDYIQDSHQENPSNENGRGYDYEDEPKPINGFKKTILCILTVVALFSIGGAGYYFSQYQKHVKEVADAVAENQKKQLEMEQKTDSIYRNFSSVDLKMANVKGYVHTIEYDGLQGYLYIKKLTFDRKGNVVDIKVQFNNYNSEYTAKWSRNVDGQIDSIYLKASYVVDGRTCDRDSHVTLKYNNDGYVIGIEISEAFKDQGDEFTLSDFKPEKGFTAYKLYDWEWFGEAGTSGNVNFGNYESDDMDNWVSRKGKFVGKDCYLDDCDDINEELTQTRSITYYEKNEIDFTPFLK